MLSQPPPFSPKMEGPLLALELRAQTLAENGNKKAQMDGQVRALVLIWVGQIKAQMGLLSLKKGPSPTKTAQKRKRPNGWSTNILNLNTF